MNITATNPELQNIGQATADQLAAWINLNMSKAGRVLSGCMVNGYLVTHYRTKTGYFVRCVLDQYGQPKEKKHYRNWNETAGEPCNLIFPENETE